VLWISLLNSSPAMGEETGEGIEIEAFSNSNNNRNGNYIYKIEAA
jgi:hypothetical protein